MTTQTPLSKAYELIAPARATQHDEEQIVRHYQTYYHAQLITARQVTVRDFVSALRKTYDATCGTTHADRTISHDIPRHQRARLASILPSYVPARYAVTATYPQPFDPDAGTPGHLEVRIQNPTTNQPALLCHIPVNKHTIDMPTIVHADKDFPTHTIKNLIHKITSKIPASQCVAILTRIPIADQPTYTKLRSTQLLLNYYADTPTQLLESILLNAIARHLRWHTHTLGPVLQPPTEPASLPEYIKHIAQILSRLPYQIERLTGEPPNQATVARITEMAADFDLLTQTLSEIQRAATAKYTQLIAGTDYERTMLAKAAGL